MRVSNKYQIIQVSLCCSVAHSLRPAVLFHLTVAGAAFSVSFFIQLVSFLRPVCYRLGTVVILRMRDCVIFVIF